MRGGGHILGLRKGIEINVYQREQKERALNEFERLGLVQAIVTFLGYPLRRTLYIWYRNKIADIADYYGLLDKEYQIKQLQMEVDVLKEALNLLKKTLASI